jgi:hypothetical protein
MLPMLFPGYTAGGEAMIFKVLLINTISKLLRCERSYFDHDEIVKHPRILKHLLGQERSILVFRAMKKYYRTEC